MSDEIQVNQVARERNVPVRGWRPRGRDFDARQHQDSLLAIFGAVRRAPVWDHNALMRILAQHPRDSKEPALRSPRPQSLP
jgi:hypothetical protein